MAEFERDSKGRFTSKKKPQTKTEKLSAKAKAQPRDSKGHFIKKPAEIVGAVVTADSMSCLSVSAAPVKEPDNTFIKTMAEVGDKLNIVIQCLNKLDDIKSFLTGNKAEEPRK